MAYKRLQRTHKLLRPAANFNFVMRSVRGARWEKEMRYHGEFDETRDRHLSMRCLPIGKNKAKQIKRKESK